MLFWSAPSAPIGLFDLPLTVLTYSLACAAALSCVLWTGAGGPPAAFLGGSIMGWLVEGVVVATAYKAFPLQLVWTPLSWHGLITGLTLIGLWRWAVGSPGRIALLLVGITAFGTVWALYWPLERAAMPGLGETLAYLAGIGVLVPVGNIVLDRLGVIGQPPRWVLAIAPALFALVWLVQFVTTLDPRWLALPLVIALAIRVLSGLRRPQPLRFEPAPRWSRHLLFLLAPMAIALATSLLWPAVGGVPTNVPIALASSGLAVAGFAWLALRAVRRDRDSIT